MYPRELEDFATVHIETAAECIPTKPRANLEFRRRQ